MIRPALEERSDRGNVGLPAAVLANGPGPVWTEGVSSSAPAKLAAARHVRNGRLGRLSCCHPELPDLG